MRLGTEYKDPTNKKFISYTLQDNVSWVIGYGVLAAVIAAGIILFLLGIKSYRKQGPLGSPFTAVAQVFTAAIRKWRVKETHDWDVYYGDERSETHMEAQPKHKTLARTKQFRYLSYDVMSFNKI